MEELNIVEFVDDISAMMRVVRAVEKMASMSSKGRAVDTSRTWFWDKELIELFDSYEALPEHLRTVD